MTPEQTKTALEAVMELEVFAGCLLDKCTIAKKLIQAAAVSTASKSRRQVLTPQQLAEISAKRRARLMKK